MGSWGLGTGTVTVPLAVEFKTKVKAVSLMAATLKTPLKFAVVGFAELADPGGGTPVMRTVPELPGTRPFDPVVVTVTIPAAGVVLFDWHRQR